MAIFHYYTMPSVPIDYTKASQALTLSETLSSPFIVSTPFGLSILEIQGLLILPSVPQNEDTVDPEHVHTFVRVNDVRDAVKFGKLLIDEKDPLKVVLFVGTSQRLNGTIETLREPLAVLRIEKTKQEDDRMRATGSNLNGNEDNVNVKRLKENGSDNRMDDHKMEVDSPEGSTDAIRMVDIIHKKIIFKHRPLPIM